MPEERHGYTPMRSDPELSPELVMATEDNPSPPGNGGTPQIRHTDTGLSQCHLAKEEHASLMGMAMDTCAEFREIVDSASVLEDVPCDTWGALVFVFVKDIPDIRAGRIMWEGKVRMAFVIVVFLVNVIIQGILLWFIAKLLMLPDMTKAQTLYKEFHEKAFVDGILDPDGFYSMGKQHVNKICGLALSQWLFVRLIIFLWIANNVGELRNDVAKTRGVILLPRLPEGLDTRLMVRDNEQTADSVEHHVICLNLKGKVGLICAVFIPKLIITSILTLTGSLWLLASESISDLILNSLALAFVVKVDEIIATTFFPEFFKKDLENLGLMLPKAHDEDGDLEKRMEVRARQFTNGFLALLISIGVGELLIRFQPVLPGYASDVTAVCVEHFNSLMPWCKPWQTDCFPVS